MNNKEIIKSHFNYLLETYGFSILREIYSPKFMGNSVVVFISDTTGIKVVVDRSQVLIDLGKITWPEDTWFEFSDVIDYYAPDEKAYIFLDEERNEGVSVEMQATRVAHILEQHCRPLLEGDFSHADEIRKLEAKRVSEMLERFRNISQKANKERKYKS